jgi:hypothetical protein
VWNSIDLRVISSTHGGRALWENLLRVAKPKKQQANRDKALKEVKGGGLGPKSQDFQKGQY